MLKRNLGNLTVMGFARYSLKSGVDTGEFIAAVRQWQKLFLAEQHGIAMHCLLGNQKGEFADAILAKDEASFKAMAEAFPLAASSIPLIGMLDKSSIHLTLNTLLKALKSVPENFSCIEFGTFSPKITSIFSEVELLAVSSKIESEYLNRFDEAIAHCMGRIDDSTYSEIAFVENTGAAREICAEYINDENCIPLLDMFDSTSVELDFWHVLA